MSGDTWLFISYSHSDEPVAAELKKLLEGIFLGAEVFVSGSSLRGGEVWIETLGNRLRAASIIVTLATRTSILEPWILFEAGAGLLDRKTIPLVCDDLTFADLPAPLRQLQGRICSEDGLAGLVSDIAHRIRARAPEKVVGAAEFIANSIAFFEERRRRVVGVDDASVEPDSSMIEFPSAPHGEDPEIEQRRTSLLQRLRSSLVSRLEECRITKALPEREDIERLDNNDLIELAKHAGVSMPFNVTSIFLSLNMQSIMGRVRQDSPEWKKAAAREQLSEAERKIDNFINSPPANHQHGSFKT